MSVFGFYLNKSEGAFKVALVFINGNIPLGDGYRKPGSRNNILRILRDKGRTVVPGTVGDLNNFLGFKCAETYIVKCEEIYIVKCEEIYSFKCADIYNFKCAEINSFKCAEICSFKCAKI